MVRGDLDRRLRPAAPAAGMEEGRRKRSALWTADRVLEVIRRAAGSRRPKLSLAPGAIKSPEQRATLLGARLFHAYQAVVSSKSFPDTLPDWPTALEKAGQDPAGIYRRKVKGSAAGMEEGANLAGRMPDWLVEVMTPEELFESVHRMHDPAIMTDRVAVLVQPGLLPPEWRSKDPFNPPLELWELAGNLRGIYGWPEEVSIRIDPWSEEAETTYREQGYRIVRVTRDEEDTTGDPISKELMLLVLSRAVASGLDIFPVNVAVYNLKLRDFSIDADEIRETLTRLYA